MATTRLNQASPTRTLNPIHFEDLEPHRFEDLVRQLAYDFRTWKVIEATGRLGSDDGIDIRGIEAGTPANESIEDVDDDEVPPPQTSQDRVWVFQCKRERSVTPQKVKDIITDGVPEGGDLPYGYVLAAACDFSKRARDTFRTELLRRGVREFYMWGKADLEDLLFLPKNDHLLFAYFNISLQVRRRALKTELRQWLAMKHKLITVLGNVREGHFTQVLLRDPRENRYPFATTIPGFVDHPSWLYCRFMQHHPQGGLTFVTRQFYAYVDHATGNWDTLRGFNVERLGYPRIYQFNKVYGGRLTASQKYREYFDATVPENNRGYVKELRMIPYEKVLAVDVDGDIVHEGPHLLLEFDGEDGPFGDWVRYVAETGLGYARREFVVEQDRRIRFFPERIEELENIVEEQDVSNDDYD